MAASISEDTIEIVLALKEEGNKAFKEQNYILAAEVYSKAIDEQRKTAGNEQLAILFSNRAATYLKTLNYTECVNDCNSALEIDPSALKAYYRRAQAYSALGDLTKAYSDLNLIIRMDPKKADAINLMRTVKAGKYACMRYE